MESPSAVDSIARPGHCFNGAAAYLCIISVAVHSPANITTLIGWEEARCALNRTGCITTGSSIDDAIEMITDAAGGWLVVAEDEGNEIPAPTPQHKLSIPENAACSIIRIDTLAYRAATDTQKRFTACMDGCHGGKAWGELFPGSPGRTYAAA